MTFLPEELLVEIIRAAKDEYCRKAPPHSGYWGTPEHAISVHSRGERYLLGRNGGRVRNDANTWSAYFSGARRSPRK